jgi:hypothetical protein
MATRSDPTDISGGTTNPASRGGGMGKQPGTPAKAGGTRGSTPKAPKFNPNQVAPKNFRGEKEPKVQATTRSTRGMGGNKPAGEGSRGFSVSGIKGFGDFEMSHTSKTR